MARPRITAVEYATLVGQRPRHAGSNARLGAHGLDVYVPLLRLTCDDGTSGFGVCHTDQTHAMTLLGMEFDALFAADSGTADAWLAFDFPLWDLASKRAGQPVYALAAACVGRAVSGHQEVPCYDTSLYFDDLDVSDDVAAAALIATEARAGYERGHRAFKIKVGRGARHMPLEQGTQRDIAIIRAVRAAVGDEPPIMIDANNGYNLNIAKRVLAETADCRVFWLEEAFHEDPVLYRDLKAWLHERELPVLVADGEGQASPTLLDWARDGLVDVIQYDIFGHGFTPWLHLGQQLDALGVRSAPHHYGRHVGNYVAGHLAAAITGFTYVEWDDVMTPGIDASDYTISDGKVTLPDAPGFGLTLDEAVFQAAVANGGFVVKA